MYAQLLMGLFKRTFYLVGCWDLYAWDKKLFMVWSAELFMRYRECWFVVYARSKGETKTK